MAVRVMNLAEVTEAIERIADCLDFTRSGAETTIGKDLLVRAAREISERASVEKGPDGAWKENRGKYGKAKRAKSLPVGKGLKDAPNERMLSLPHIKGEHDIQPLSATMTFGTDERSKNLGKYFTNGSTGAAGDRSGAKNQPPRPFYEMTPEDEDAIFDLATIEIMKYIEGP